MDSADQRLQASPSRSSYPKRTSRTPPAAKQQNSNHACNDYVPPGRAPRRTGAEAQGAGTQAPEGVLDRVTGQNREHHPSHRSRGTVAVWGRALAIPGQLWPSITIQLRRCVLIPQRMRLQLARRWGTARCCCQSSHPIHLGSAAATLTVASTVKRSDITICLPVTWPHLQVNMGAAAAAVFAAASLMVAPISVAADAATIKVRPSQ